MRYKVEEVDNDVVINDIIIDEKVFNNEMVKYRFLYRESEIDNLIQMISECNNADKYAMKQDLSDLMVWTDTLILSHGNTNDYVSETSDIKAFNEIIIEILKAHKKLHPETIIRKRYNVHFEKTLGLDVEVYAFSEEDATEQARNSKLDESKINNDSGFEYCYTDSVEVIK